MDTEGLPSKGCSPSEELIFEKAECRACGAKRHADARAWAHQHAGETGHAVELYIGYDVRPDDWMDRLTTERRAELDELKADPQMARGLAEHLLRDSKGQKPH